MKRPKEIDYEFKINYEKLWALVLPIKEVSISSLQNNLDIPYLEMEGTDDWNLSINQLLSNLKDEPNHTTKMENADLSHPIDMYKYNDQWIILDGVHRLAKAISLGYKTVKVREISEDLVASIKE